MNRQVFILLQCYETVLCRPVPYLVVGLAKRFVLKFVLLSARRKCNHAPGRSKPESRIENGNGSPGVFAAVFVRMRVLEPLS
jgi:hypothetical protein